MEIVLEIIKETISALAMIEKFSPNAKACKLTMGYKDGELKYHHTYFGVPKESPYQEELRKQYVSRSAVIFKLAYCLLM